jgi:hypothetical protein
VVAAQLSRVPDGIATTALRTAAVARHDPAVSSPPLPSSILIQVRANVLELERIGQERSALASGGQRTTQRLRKWCSGEEGSMSILQTFSDYFAAGNGDKIRAMGMAGSFHAWKIASFYCN